MGSLVVTKAESGAITLAFAGVFWCDWPLALCEL
jgi:hypothetical protein